MLATFIDVLATEETLEQAIDIEWHAFLDLNITNDQVFNLFVRQGDRSHGRRDESEGCDNNGQLHGEQRL